MSIRIYNVNGIGIVIGEKLSQDNDYVYLKYPGAFVQQMTQNGQQTVMAEIVPAIFEGRDEMLKRFPLKKSLIICGGRPVSQMSEVYEQYATQLQSRLSGIQVVGAGAMPKQTVNNRRPTIVS
jgi:hypothetical protein